MPFDDWLLGYIERGQQQDIGPGQTHRVRVLNDRVAVVFLTCRIAGVKARSSISQRRFLRWQPTTTTP